MHNNVHPGTLTYVQIQKTCPLKKICFFKMMEMFEFTHVFFVHPDHDALEG